MSDLFGTDYDGRKAIPVFEGVLMYFPKAIAAIAEVSQAGNAQHNPGEPLHWARGKSMDQYNTALRHMMDHRMGGGRIPDRIPSNVNNGWSLERKDKDGVRHLAKAAWRILAALELDIEADEAEAKEIAFTSPREAKSEADADGNYTQVCRCGYFTFQRKVGDIDPSVVFPGNTRGISGTHTPSKCHV